MASPIINIKGSDGEATGKKCIVDMKQKLSGNNTPLDGAALFKGRFETSSRLDIAVKRYTNPDKENKPTNGYAICFERARTNLEFLSLLGNKHPNLINYFGHEEICIKGEQENSPVSWQNYLFTELCICSVNDLVLKKPNSTGISNAVLPYKAILKQSAMAVNFLHGLGLVHRNLHPGNFLISYNHTVKLTDFQLAKDWEKFPKDSYIHPMNYWRVVPEWKPEESKRNSKSDVFTLGCYFHFVLSGGGHPFGDPGSKDLNKFYSTSKPCQDDWNPDHETWLETSLFTKGCKDPNVTSEDEAIKAQKLIWNMVRVLPTDRMSMWGVLDSDYFQKEPSHYPIYDNLEKLPGLCVIICQEKFHHPLNDMDGMAENCAQLRRTFLRFGYEVLVYQNIEANQIEHYLNPINLEKNSKEKDYSKYASLVVCILSHGEKGVILGVDAENVQIEQLKRKFNNFACDGLAWKPKVFIIFACQGNQDQIVHYERPTTTQPIIETVGSEDTKSAMEDFLTLMSTVEDFYSYYTAGVGSPFIEHLCGALISEYNEKESHLTVKNKKDLASLFHSYVVPFIGHKEIATVKGNRHNYTVRQTPESRSTLTKTIRFEPRESTYTIATWMMDAKNSLAVHYNGMEDKIFLKKRLEQIQAAMSDPKMNIPSNRLGEKEEEVKLKLKIK